MFIHQFVYTLKVLLKSKSLIFWTLAFPLILGTFFDMALSDIENNEKLETIPIAIVDDASYQKEISFQEAIKALSDPSGEHYLFDVKYVSKKKAVVLLKEEKIDGYIQIKKKPQIYIHENGVNQTILKATVDEISQREELITNYVQAHMSIESNMQNVYNHAIGIVNKDTFSITDISKKHMSYSMIEFYSLIAMTCLYGGILGMVVINMTLPNMSNNGMRIAISPVSKMKLILSGLCAAYVIQLIGVALLFAYTTCILHKDYGSQFGLILLLTLAGCLSGSALGIFVGAVFKQNDNMKTSIIIALTMIGSFLSGMMGITMKYTIDTYVPWLNQINPVSMITDGLYSLYYYTGHVRYWQDVLHLCLFSIILIAISMHCLRRQTYDHL